MPFCQKHIAPDYYTLKIHCTLYNVPEIASYYLVSNATVRRWLRREGLSAKARVRQPLRLERDRGSEWHTQKRAVNKRLAVQQTCANAALALGLSRSRVERLCLEEPDPVGYTALLEWALEQGVNRRTVTHRAQCWVRTHPGAVCPLYLRYKRQWWRRKT